MTALPSPGERPADERLAVPLPVRAEEGEGMELPDEHDEARTEPRELLERNPDTRTLALLGLLTLGVFYTLYFARPVILPVVLAMLLAFVLDPVVGFFSRLRLPRALAAGLVIFGLLGGTGFAVFKLSGPAADWIEEAPAHFAELEQKLVRIRGPVEDVGRATEEVEKITRMGPEQSDPERVVSEPSLATVMWQRVRKFISDGVITVTLLFFLLASGDLFLRKVAKVLPSIRSKKRAVKVARHVRHDISTFLGTLSAINVGLGLAVTGLMLALDMPNPLLWGVMAGLLNFVPYLGPLVGVTIVAMVSLLTFDSIGRAALAPLGYLALNALEGSLVTPAIMGRQLALNPVAVFISLLFWGWIWGIPGALMAVPLVVTAKIVCDHYEPLAGFGEFLGRE